MRYLNRPWFGLVLLAISNAIFWSGRWVAYKIHDFALWVAGVKEPK